MGWGWPRQQRYTFTNTNRLSQRSMCANRELSLVFSTHSHSLRWLTHQTFYKKWAGRLQTSLKLSCSAGSWASGASVFSCCLIVSLYVKQQNHKTSRLGWLSCSHFPMFHFFPLSSWDWNMDCRGKKGQKRGYFPHRRSKNKMMSRWLPQQKKEEHANQGYLN